MWGRASRRRWAGVLGVLSCVGPDPPFHSQFQPSMVQRELPVPIYVTRGEGQRLDNAHSLHGQLGGGGVGRAGHAAGGGASPCLLNPPHQ